MKSGNILITGATGFIGLELVELLAKTANLYVLARNTKKTHNLLLNQVKIIKYNFENLKLPSIPSTINVVVHLAANIDYFGSYKKLAKTNVLGTKHLLQALPKSVSKFIYISTIEAAQPKTNYGKTKLKAEKLVVDHAKQKRFAYTVLRLGNIYGLQHRFIIDEVKRMITDKNFYLRSYYHYLKDISVFPVFITDVVRAIEKTLVENYQGTFTLTGKQSYTIKQIADLLVSLLKTKDDRSYKNCFYLLFQSRRFWHKLKGQADFVDYLLNKAEAKEISKTQSLPYHYQFNLKESLKKIYQL